MFPSQEDNTMEKRIIANIRLSFTMLSVAFLIIGGAFALYYIKGAEKVTTKDIESAQKISGLRFTGKERKMMLRGLRRNLSSYEEMRGIALENHVPPAIQFNPILPGMSLSEQSSSG